MAIMLDKKLVEKSVVEKLGHLRRLFLGFPFAERGHGEGLLDVALHEFVPGRLVHEGAIFSDSPSPSRDRYESRPVSLCL